MIILRYFLVNNTSPFVRCLDGSKDVVEWGHKFERRRKPKKPRRKTDLKIFPKGRVSQDKMNLVKTEMEIMFLDFKTNGLLIFLDFT